MSQSLRYLVVLVAAVFLNGCGGSKDGFYRLGATEPAVTGSSAGVSVSIGPVSLPSYIDRNEVVFQSGANEFELPTDARWIGSLQENVGRVLADNLGSILGSSRVRSAVDNGNAAQYRVALNIQQFHGVSGGEAILDVSWRIETAGRQTIARGSRVFHEPIIGDGYEPLVAAESRLLGQCAHAIAASFRGR